MPNSPDDLAALKAERAAADREYNEALTRLDRDVAGLLRGLAGAIDAVADETMKRSETMLTRDRRHELRVSDLDARMDALHRQMLAIQQALEKACPERDAHPSTGSG